MNLLLGLHDAERRVYNARRKPAKIQYLFDRFDALVDAAAAKGIRIHLSLTGPAPRWARPQAIAAPGLVQAERARVRQVGRGRRRALRRSRRPLQHLERAQLEDLARAAHERAGALPQPLHARLRRDQEGRPAREGADRRDQPVRAQGPVDRAARVPAQGGLREHQVQARAPLPDAEGGRLRAPPVRLPARARTSSTRAPTTSRSGTLRRLTQGARQARARRARCARTAAAACRST